VPASYRGRWDSSACLPTQSPAPTFLSGAPVSIMESDSIPPKLNSSCVQCRKSKVKCTGGNPCRRCESSLDPSACTYNASRRRGKRKADDSNIEWHVQQAGVSSQNILRDGGINLTEPLQLSLVEKNGEDGNIWSGADESGHAVSAAFPDPSIPLESYNIAHAASPSLTEILNSLGPSGLPPGPFLGDIGICSESCFISVHSVTNQLSSIRKSKGAVRLDKIFCLITDSIHQAAKYLACEHCDSGCSRLMTLSFLHQWQINILLDVTNNPTIYFTNETPELKFGEYRASAEDDIAFKRMVSLRLTRDIKLSLDRFHHGAKDFEERYIAGTLELGEAGKLNLEWLLKVAVSLKRQAEFIAIAEEKRD
ncbi:hypothetical protein TRIATDRAFT_178083, partial [Trichoderma atroviride IMI 206040]